MAGSGDVVSIVVVAVAVPAAAFIVRMVYRAMGWGKKQAAFPDTHVFKKCASCGRQARVSKFHKKCSNCGAELI